MSENQMVERVKVLLNRSSVDSATTVYPVISSALLQTPEKPQETLPLIPSPSGGRITTEPPQVVVPDSLSDEALQVLTLAQRTAEAHVAAAHTHASQTREAAAAAAAQIQRDAQAYAEQVRAEADAVLAAAHTAAQAVNHDAHTQAAGIHGQAESILTDARNQAETIIAGGTANAGQLQLQAQLRYEDAVGGLAIKREALQKQIETLETFDADYRHRLTVFLQSQLRALWADQPHATEVLIIEMPIPGGPVDTV